MRYVQIGREDLTWLWGLVRTLLAVSFDLLCRLLLWFADRRRGFLRGNNLFDGLLPSRCVLAGGRRRGEGAWTERLRERR